MLLQQLRAFCAQHGNDKTYWIAYSGGLDSHVLLSLCSALRSELNLNLRAIHVNHGMSAHALQWSEHCARVCDAYAIPLTMRTLTSALTSSGNLEATMRDARYHIFAETLSTNDMLLTAHHQDDQAETILLQLMRGAGVKGLAAMPMIKSFAAGYHGRPLLNIPRTALQQYAEQHGLNWIEDESNENQQFARNYLRQTILPLLKSRWPAVTTTLARSATHCAEAQQILEDFAEEALTAVAGTRADTLSVSKLLLCLPERQRLLLRCWIQQQGYQLPDARKLATIQRDVFNAAWDRLPCVRWGEVELRRYRDDLYLLTSQQKMDLQLSYMWELQQPLTIPGLGSVQATVIQGGGLHANTGAVTIRFRQGGEKMAIPGRGRQTLKNLFQEWNILPWERERVPLIYIADQLIGVVGYFIHADYLAKNAEPGYQISLRL
jgi:tRNA(Ile)-lysidine synthase